MFATIQQLQLEDMTFPWNVKEPTEFCCPEGSQTLAAIKI